MGDDHNKQPLVRKCPSECMHQVPLRSGNGANLPSAWLWKGSTWVSLMQAVLCRVHLCCTVCFCLGPWLAFPTHSQPLMGKACVELQHWPSDSQLLRRHCRCGVLPNELVSPRSEEMEDRGRSVCHFQLERSFIFYMAPLCVTPLSISCLQDSSRLPA